MYGLGTKQEVKTVRLFRVGFLANLVKMIKKELDLVGEIAQIKEKNRDAVQIAPLVKLTKGGKENDARLDDYTKRTDLS